MSIHTILNLMASFRVGTPYCFVVKVEEIYVLLELIYQVDRNFSFAMGKGTVISKLAFSFKTDRTKFGLVFVRVVEFLDSSVTVGTLITLWTPLLLGDDTAEL